MEGQVKKMRKYWNNEKKQDFFKKYKPKKNNSNNPPKRIEKKSIQHNVDVSKLLDAAKLLILWSYDPTNKHITYTYFPDYLKKGMHTSTFSGTCWKLAHGCSKRPKLMPEPFILVYGRYVVGHAYNQTVSLMFEDGYIFPAPVGLEDEDLRWVVIWRDRIDYHVRIRQRLPSVNIKNLPATTKGVSLIPGQTTDDNDDE